MPNPYDDIPLSGEPAKASGNPYDAILDNEASAIRGSLVNAMQANPDQAAKAARLARQVGAPPSAVEAHLPDVEANARLDSYAKMIERAPKTGDLLRNPDKARMAHDDVETLSGWEKTAEFLKNSGKALVSGVPTFNEGFWGVGQAGAEMLSKFVTGPLAGTILPEDIGAKMAGGFARQRQISKSFRESLTPKVDGNIESGWYSGLQSMVSSMLSLLAAALTGNPELALAPMAATTGGQAYGEARDKGVGVGQSLAFGASQAAIEYATEKLPVSWLLKDLKAGAGVGKTIARQMAAEVPGEQVATALQDLNEWATLNPERPFVDYLKARPGAAVQTLVATLVGTAGQTGAIKLADMAMNAAQGKQQEAQGAGQSAELLAGLNKLAEASKVRERDPETAREFFQSVLDGGNDSVWITPDALAQSGLADQVAQAIPAVAEQLATAAETGHDIRVPVADLMATMAGPELAQSILPHVSTEPGGFTQTTAEEYLQSGQAEELRAEIDRLLEGKDKDEAFNASAQEVEDAVFAELQGAGRHAESVNRADAMLHRHFFSVMAAKIGEMPKALFDRYALKVRAQAGDGAMLDQIAWHGTPHAWAPEPGFPHGRPRLDKMGTGEGAQSYGWGWYSAESRDVGEQYQKQNTFRVFDISAEASRLGISLNAGARGEIVRQARTAKPPDAAARSVQYANIAAREIDAGKLSSLIDAYRKAQSGNLYQLDIPDDVLPHLLDWDKPLSEQSPNVQEAINRLGLYDEMSGKTGEQIYNEMVSSGRVSVDYGPGFIARNRENPKRVSEKLASVGIVGLRYLDGNSRSDGKGTHNFVIWDQPTLDRIALLERNGEKLDAMREAGTYAQSALPPTITINGTERPTTNSKGQPIAQDEAGVRNFWKWFGDSKVVDDEGRPLVVYHGTSNDFARFNLKKLGENTIGEASSEEIGQTSRIGHWFSSHPMGRSPDNYGAGYSIDMPVYLKITNQFSVEENDDLAVMLEGGKKGSTLRRDLASQGYDGVRIKRDTEFDGSSFIAFAGSQVKSATGNNGQFSPDDANILRQEGANRGTFNPSTNTIALLKDADLSTFLHESGHFFLEVQADLAAQIMQQANIHGMDTLSEGERSILADTQALMDWFGIDNLQAWELMDFEQRRFYHEKFARGFEAYLYSGKAPSVAMHGLFQRFRAWLVRVYKSIKAIDVSVSPEVRGVFDRMLASTEEIRQAEQARSMIDLFATPDQAGWTPEQFAAYHALGTDATNAAIEELQARSLRDLRWTKNAIARAVVRISQEAKARRNDLEMEARREVMSQPVYRAWQFLTGRLSADDKIKPEAKPKSDPNTVDETVDSLFVAIAKLGGLNKQEAIETWGIDPADKPQSGVFGKPVWRIDGGLSIDGMGEALSQYGYLSLDDNGRWDIRELEEMFRSELGGDKKYSVAFDAGAFMEPPKAGEEIANPGALNAARLDAESLKDTTLTREQIELLKARRMTANEGGLHPDVVVDKFPEFESGDALVRALVEATPPKEAIDALVNQRMLEQYGELASPEAIQQAADMAVFNEARARAIATELQALDKAMSVRGDAGKNVSGGRKTFAVLPKAAQDFAGEMIARLKIKDIIPGRYSGAATRAAKAAIKAEKAGDIETAASEKRTQLLNHFATRAAYDAKEEVAKIDAFFKKVVGGKDALVGKTRDMDLVNAARAVLAAYGYAGKANDATEYVKLVQANDPTWMADVIRKAVEEAQANGKPIRELTLEELRGLKDEVEGLWHLAERNRKMEIDGKLMDRRAVAAALVSRMREVGIPKSAPGESSAITPEEVVAMRISSTKALGRRVESWVDLKDGNTKIGVFRRYLWQPIKEAADRYRTELAQRLRTFREAFAVIAPTMKKGTIDAHEIGYAFGKDSGGVAMNELLHAILHTGNESNKRKLLLGRNWATLRDDGSLNTARWNAFVARMIEQGVLTKAHFDFAQSVWDQLEAMKPGAQKAHRDATGKYFSEVTSTPFDTPWGRYRGGYVPAKVDGRIVKDMELKKLIEEGAEGMSYAFPSAPKGFTKARAEGYTEPLLLDLRLLPQHIDSVLLFTHMELPARDAARLLGYAPVRDALNLQDPAAINDMLIPWLHRSALQQVTTPVPGAGWMMRFLNGMRNRVGMAYMFANISNAIQQVTGFPMAAVKVKPSSLARAMAQYIKAPRQTAAEVALLSPYMAGRMDNEVAAMRGEIDAILIDPSLYERAQDWTKRHAYFLQTAVENIMGTIIWKAAYDEALAENWDLKDAARIADSVIRQTQGSALPEDVSRIETGPAYGRIFTQFAGYFNMQANLLGSELGKVTQEMGLKKGAGRALFVLLAGFYAPALVAELIAQLFNGGPGDDDRDGTYIDDWLMALFVYGPARTATAMLPIAGQIINSSVARFNANPVDDRVSLAPIVGAIEASAGVPYDAYKTATGEANASRSIKDVATLVSLLTGLPAHAVARPISYLAGVAQGNTDPTGPVDVARGLVTGAASPESRGR